MSVLISTNFEKFRLIITNYKKYDNFFFEKNLKNICKEYRRFRVILKKISKNV